MKKAMLFKLSLLFASAPCLLHSYAQDSPQWGLPEGAKARLGKGSISKIQYSPDGTRLAVASSIGIWLYDTVSNQEASLFTGHTSVVSVAFSPDGGTIAGGSRGATIQLWDADTGKHLRTLKGHTHAVVSVLFSPDGSRLASGGWDHTIRLWDLDKGKHRRTLNGHRNHVWSVAFSPNGRIIASGSSDDTIQLWDADAGELLRTLTRPSAVSVFSVAFSPDGSTIASGSLDNTISLWEVDTGKHLRKPKGHTEKVSSVAFSPDGHTLASGSWDGTVLLWEVAFLTELAVKPLARRSTTLGNIKRTALLQNYPNPFNPETWIPYQLANDALVTLNIYDQSGHIVRTLDIGRQISGVYLDKARAAYWDGRNQNGEPVTSGTYYYQLRAGDYTATRRMVIVK